MGFPCFLNALRSSESVKIQKRKPLEHISTISSVIHLIPDRILSDPKLFEIKDQYMA